MNKYGTIYLVKLLLIEILLFTIRLDANLFFILIASLILAIIGIILAFLVGGATQRIFIA